MLFKKDNYILKKFFNFIGNDSSINLSQKISLKYSPIISNNKPNILPKNSSMLMALCATDIYATASTMTEFSKIANAKQHRNTQEQQLKRHTNNSSLINENETVFAAKAEIENKTTNEEVNFY